MHSPTASFHAHHTGSYSDTQLNCCPILPQDGTATSPLEYECPHTYPSPTYHPPISSSSCRRTRTALTLQSISLPLFPCAPSPLLCPLFFFQFTCNLFGSALCPFGHPLALAAAVLPVARQHGQNGQRCHTHTAPIAVRVSHSRIES